VKKSAFVLTIAALGVVAAAAGASNRYAAAAAARAGREEVQQALVKAVALAAEHPRAFGPDAAAPMGDSSLKALAQEAAASRGVSLGYLSESERETDKGRRERQVLLRLVNAAHPNLVLFLQDLETRGGGAKVKELHLRPSREIPDAYEEVEVVLSKTVAAQTERKP
jgi:hypothetical protein